MVARLGFAVATEACPDVLLVDEVLAVGDEPFRLRCYERIDRLRRGGTSVVLVTHDLSLTRACDRVLRLHDGKLGGQPAPAAAGATEVA